MEQDTNSDSQAQHASHGIGPLVATLIVLSVLILGGVYFLNSHATSERSAPPVILGDENADAGLPPTSPSDDINAIESDINATDLHEVESNIDADLQTIEMNL